MESLLNNYVTREDLARELNVTTRTLDKWAYGRKGPAKIKVGARVYYNRDDVRLWLESQRAAAKGGQ